MTALLRLTLLAPAVVDNLLANPDVAINLERVLRRVMPLDWQAQGAVFARAVVTASRAQFGSYGWRDHCRGLFQIQVAA